MTATIRKKYRRYLAVAALLHVTSSLIVAPPGRDSTRASCTTKQRLISNHDVKPDQFSWSSFSEVETLQPQTMKYDTYSPASSPKEQVNPPGLPSFQQSIPIIPVEDFQWFEPTLLEIEEKYRDRYETLSRTTENDRKSTPRTVPENTNDIIKDLLHEEMEKEIKRRLSEMKAEQRRREKARNKKTITKRLESVQETVQRVRDELIQKTQPVPDAQIQDQSPQARKLALRKGAHQPRGELELGKVRENIMERLEETMKTIPGDQADQIDEDIERMWEDHTEQGVPFKPATYADWKKYQEIKSFLKETSDTGRVDEKDVLRRFLDWKAFMSKQEATMNAFESDDATIGAEIAKLKDLIPQAKKEFSDVVADINRKSLKALEEVLETRRGSPDEQALERRIERLRASLEAVGYVDMVEEDETEEEALPDEPIDVAELFPRFKSKRGGNDEDAEETLSQTKAGDGVDLPGLEPPQIVPDALITVNIEDGADKTVEAPPPPPDSPFFSQEAVYNSGVSSDGSDINLPPDERSTGLIGTYEEQKLKNIYRQGGAKSKEEQEKVKQEFLDFQQYQEEMMKKLEALEDELINIDPSSLPSLDDKNFSLSALTSTLKADKEDEATISEVAQQTPTDSETKETVTPDIPGPTSQPMKPVASVDSPIVMETANDDFIDPFPVASREPEFDHSSYRSRKRALLERAFLNSMDINALMDLKETSISEVLAPQKDTPLQDCGMIFRLEGLLVDLSGVMHHAWAKVAESKRIECPSEEAVRLASVRTPEYAVEKVFKWSQEQEVIRDISTIFRRCLSEEVELLAPSNKISSITEQTPSSAADNGTQNKQDQSLRQNVDTDDLKKEMYRLLAGMYGFPPPTDSQLDIASKLSPAQAIDEYFLWSSEANPTEKLVSDLKNIYRNEQYRRNLLILKAERAAAAIPQTFALDDANLVVPPGGVAWVRTLSDLDVPCGIISYLDKSIVEKILGMLGLSDLIPEDKRVTGSDVYQRDDFRQLGACLRLDRRPEFCVLFDSNPDCLSDARENEIRSIGMPLVHPPYDLLAADSIVQSFDGLSTMNIRRLFGERENQVPQLQVFSEEPRAKRRKTAVMETEADGDGGDKDKPPPKGSVKD